MKKQIVTIALGAVLVLGAATTSFAATSPDVFHIYCSGSTTSC